MSLADFVQEQVQKASSADFIVKDDLIKSYTQWRQERQPTMQLDDLYKAQQDVDSVLPEEDYHDLLVVNGEDGQTGHVDCAWKGYKLDWPGGNTTQPRLVAPDFGALETGPAVHYAFHFTNGYDSSQFSNYLQNRVCPTPANALALQAKLKDTVPALQKSIADLDCPWLMETVTHEGVCYNVFVGSQSPLSPA